MSGDDTNSQMRESELSSTG